MKTSELIGPALDWSVAKCEGYIDDRNSWLYGATLKDVEDGSFRPSSSWSQGGPIIERERIEVTQGNPLYFPQGNEQGDHYEPLWLAGKQHGQTVLIAAMRYYVASKLGDEIEIPSSFN
jgi:hypothetical protein